MHSRKGHCEVGRHPFKLTLNEPLASSKVQKIDFLWNSNFGAFRYLEVIVDDLNRARVVLDSLKQLREEVGLAEEGRMLRLTPALRRLLSGRRLDMGLEAARC